MAAKMRRAVGHVTDVVFPSGNLEQLESEKLLKQDHEYVSNLPLQMTLYFNVFFFPIWLVTECVMFEAKFSSLSTLYQIIVIAIIIVMSIVETVRLYLGYLGNLTEKVPELAGSWLLSLLLQLPLILFLLLNSDTIILPLERAVHIIMTVFVLFEVVLGYFAIRAMVNSQMTKFHLQQFHDIKKEDGMENRYTQ